LRGIKLVILAGTLLFSQLAHGQPVYKSFRYKYPSDGKGLTGVGQSINGKGEIAGIVTNLSRSNSPVQGFYRSPEGAYTLINFPPALLGEPAGTPVNTYINGINYSGEMIGTVFDSVTGDTHAFLLSAVGGQFTLIDPPGMTVTNGLGIGIKNTGESLGTANSLSSAESYIRSPSNSYQFIACPEIASSSLRPLTFNSINDHGNSVGTYWATTSLPHAFTRTAGGTCALFTDVPGAIATVANSINDSALVAGGYVDSDQSMHGFVWNSSTGFQTVDSGRTGTTLVAINSIAVVLGKTDSNIYFYAAPQSPDDLTVPASAAFGSVSVGTTSKQVLIYIHNPSSDSIVLDIPAVTSSTNGSFAIVSNGCPLILSAEQACTLGVTMTPTVPGSVTGVLQLDSNAANAPGQVQLSGTAN
jgi:hypothetical protein